MGDTENPGVFGRFIKWVRRRPALAALVLLIWLTITINVVMMSFYELKVNKLETEINELRKQIDQLRKGQNGR